MPSNFEKMTPELLLYLLQYLDIDSVISFIRVNKSIHKTSSSEQFHVFWKGISHLDSKDNSVTDCRKLILRRHSAMRLITSQGLYKKYTSEIKILTAILNDDPDALVMNKLVFDGKLTRLLNYPAFCEPSIKSFLSQEPVLDLKNGIATHLVWDGPREGSLKKFYDTYSQIQELRAYKCFDVLLRILVALNSINLNRCFMEIKEIHKYLENKNDDFLLTRFNYIIMECSKNLQLVSDAIETTSLTNLQSSISLITSNRLLYWLLRFIDEKQCVVVKKLVAAKPELLHIQITEEVIVNASFKGQVGQTVFSYLLDVLPEMKSQLSENLFPEHKQESVAILKKLQEEILKPDLNKKTIYHLNALLQRQLTVLFNDCDTKNLKNEDTPKLTYIKR